MQKRNYLICIKYSIEKLFFDIIFYLLSNKRIIILEINELNN